MANVVNYLLYQIGWFAIVAGAAWHRPWLGLVIALGLVVIHLLLARDRDEQCKILASTACVGLLGDTLLLTAGVFRFPSGMLVAWLPPLWMTVLWIQFATTFRYCLRWMSGRYTVAGLLGLLGAPLAFVGGESLGAVEIQTPSSVHLALLGVVWAFVLPLAIFLSDRIAERNTTVSGYRGFD